MLLVGETLVDPDLSPAADVPRARELTRAEDRPQSQGLRAGDRRSRAGRGYRGFLATFGDHAASRNRRPSRSSLARPYICRLSVLSRLICPSTGPVLHGSVAAARTAASSVARLAAKPRNAGSGPSRGHRQLDGAGRGELT